MPPSAARRPNGWSTDLQAIGFDASVRDTPGHPMVVAHHDGPAPDSPHVLFYGHYDVQPVDPLELWENDPFDAGDQGVAPMAARCITGRGTVRRQGPADDLRRGLPRLEGRCTAAALPRHHPVRGRGGIRLAVAEAVPRRQPGRAEGRFRAGLRHRHVGCRDAGDLASLRGLVGEEIVIKAADRDLHSGMYGGAAANPIRILAKILADIHDENGRVTIPGFYDGVEETPDADAEDLGDARRRRRRTSSARSACRSRPARRAARCWN